MLLSSKTAHPTTRITPMRKSLTLALFAALLGGCASATVPAAAPVAAPASAPHYKTLNIFDDVADWYYDTNDTLWNVTSSSADAVAGWGTTAWDSTKNWVADGWNASVAWASTTDWVGIYNGTVDGTCQLYRTVSGTVINAYVDTRNGTVSVWQTTLGLFTVQGHVQFRRAALGTCNGVNFVCAEGGGGRELVANRTAIGPWETFEFCMVNGSTLQSGSKIIIRTADRKHYLCAEGGGAQWVSANRDTASTWETFHIYRVAGSGTLNPGDQVYILASNNMYVTAEGGGGGQVNANRTKRGPWETFTYIPR
jgi:hypothetical protein